jgi:hypothetical protein
VAPPLRSPLAEAAPPVHPRGRTTHFRYTSVQHLASPAAGGPLRAPLLACLLLLAVACGPDEERLEVERRIPLPAGVAGATSLAASGGRIWISGGRALVALDTAGRLVTGVPMEASGARIVAVGASAVYLRTPATRLLVVDPGVPGVRARRAGVGEDGFALDPRGGDGYVVRPHGGILGVDAATLRPKWGWPERGAPGTALAVSPLGDRVYLALGGDEPRILTRDAQSGRVLAETEAPGEVRRLLAGPDGVLYALVGEGRRGALLALRPGPEGLETVWREELGSIGAGDSARVVVSSRGDRLAVVSAEGEGTARLLDARTGRLLRSSRPGVVDAAFAPDGALWLLRADELRVAR